MEPTNPPAEPLVTRTTFRFATKRVTAAQLRFDNSIEIADIVNGRVHESIKIQGGFGGPMRHELSLEIPMVPKPVVAHLGEWIICHPEGFIEVVSDQVYLEHYRED